MRAAVIFVFATLLATYSAHADTYRCVDKSGILTFSDRPCQTESPPIRKEAETFSANVLIVKSHSEIENWVKLEPAKRQGDVGRVRIVTRGVKFYLPIIATFSQSQVGQRIALAADLEIVAPGGKVHKLSGCCIANRVDPRASTTIVLNPVMDIPFDATDPSGEYRVRTRIHNGKESVVADETFRLQ
jgi:hypothetical protein